MTDVTDTTYTVTLWKQSITGYDEVKSWDGYRNLEHATKLFKRVAGTQSSPVDTDRQYRVDLGYRTASLRFRTVSYGHCSGESTLYTSLLSENPEDID